VKPVSSPGRVRIAGGLLTRPVLQVDKRGRFITNMGQCRDFGMDSMTRG
jgi:hypothetical protein